MWRDEIVRVGEVDLHLQTGGDGGPIVGLHGVTDSAALLSRLGEALTCWGEVILVDQRGHGSSSRANSYRYEDLAADVVAVLRARGAERALLVGHSMGAMVSLLVAASAPERVVGVVAIDPPMRSRAAIEAADRTVSFAWMDELRGLSFDQLVAVSRTEHPAWPALDHRKWAESQLATAPEVTTETGLDVFRDWRPIASRVAAPVLILHGDEARGSIVAASSIPEATGLLEKATIVRIPDTGHLPHLDSQGACLSAIDRWLSLELPGRYKR